MSNSDAPGWPSPTCSGGDLETHTKRLNAAYAEAEAKDPGAILLNFEGVDYIDSAGIVLIGNLLAKARASKRRLLAYGLSDHYVEIFDITRLSDFVSVFPDEESALSGASVSR